MDLCTFDLTFVRAAGNDHVTDALGLSSLMVNNINQVSVLVATYVSDGGAHTPLFIKDCTGNQGRLRWMMPLKKS
jgi:hypothetical protein